MSLQKEFWYEISKYNFSYQWVLDMFWCLLSCFIVIWIDVMTLFVPCILLCYTGIIFLHSYMYLFRIQGVYFVFFFLFCHLSFVLQIVLLLHFLFISPAFHRDKFRIERSDKNNYGMKFGNEKFGTWLVVLTKRR